MHRPVFLALALALVVAAAAPAPARADAPPAPLPYSLAIDGTVAAVGVAAWISSELAKPALAPAACRWCAPDGLDVSVRDALKWSDTGTADTISNVMLPVQPLLVGGLLTLADGLDGRVRDAPVDLLLVVEATAIAMDLDQLTKYVVGRERPFVHYTASDKKAALPMADDNDLSFFSGHTTYTTAIAMAAGTVATLRHRRYAPLVWAVGLAAALGTGYLRIGADKHWFTDVATGLVVGGGVGFAVPWLFHRPARHERARGASVHLGALPLQAGFGVALGGAW